jgi:hypothetical protein
MATIEFQMSTTAFLRAQRNALLRLQTCLPGPFAMGSVNIVLDRIDFGANALVHNVAEEFDIIEKGFGGGPDDFVLKGKASGFKTQMTQDVTVHVTTLEDILSHPDQSPAVVVPIQGTLVFEISAFALPDTGIFITIAFQQNESTIAPPPGLFALPVDWDELSQTIMTEMAKILPSPTIPIDLKDLAKTTRFINAGISVDSTLSVFALRADNSLNPLFGTWINFYRGIFDNRLGGNEWALFIGEKFMGSVIDARVDAGLKDLPSELEIIPHTTYSNAGGRAVFTIDLSITVDPPEPAGTIVNTFPGLAGSGHVDIKIPVEIRLSPPTELVCEADLSTIQDQAESFLGLIGLLVDALGISLQGFIDAGARSILSDAGDDAEQCQVTPEHHIRCTKPIKAPNVGMGMAFGITSLLPLADGVSLAGNLRMSDLSPAVLDIGTHHIQMMPPDITCGSAGAATIAAFGSNPKAWEILHGRILIINHGTAPLTLCDYQVVGNDWANAFPRTGIRPDGTLAPISMAVRFAVPGDPYYQGGGPGFPGNYPCLVLIKTTAGTRAVSLGQAPVVTSEDLDRLQAGLLVKVGDCQILMDNWFDGDHAHIPEWFVPDPPDLLVDHHWNVLVAGLRPGEAAALTDTDGRQVVRAVAQADAPVRLSAVVRSVAGQRDVTLIKIPAANLRRAAGEQPVRTSARDREAVKGGTGTRAGNDEKAARGIGVTQQSLVFIGAARLAAPCIDIVAARRPGTRLIVAVMPDSVAAFDVSQPLQPMLVGQWSFSGARGAVPWRGGVLAFGAEGFALVDEHGLLRPDAGQCGAPPVLSAAAAGDRLYALAEDGLAIHDARLCKQRTVELPSEKSVPHSIVAAGRSMILGGSDGLMALETDGPPSLRRLAAKGRLHVRRLSTPTMRRTGASVLAELEDGTARLLDVGNGRAEEVVWFAESPWFAHVARLGSLLAHRRTDANRLELYRLGPSAVQ